MIEVIVVVQIPFFPTILITCGEFIFVIVAHQLTEFFLYCIKINDKMVWIFDDLCVT